MVEDREAILNLLRMHRSELTQMGVRSIALFGSAARDKLMADSDIDLLADLIPPYTFDRYVQVKFYLEDLFNRPVDLIMKETLKPRVRPYVEKEAIYVT